MPVIFIINLCFLKFSLNFTHILFFLQLTPMSKFLKWTAIIGIILLVLVSSGVSYLKFMFPKVSKAPDLKVEITPGRVQRGDYLANHVSVCMDCHSRRDWSQWSGPIISGTKGGGGEAFPKSMGFPGDFYSKNLTPYYLKDWTDGEIFRAITSGVNKDGDPLFPIMPYHYYGQMDEEDIYSIIAYLRTLPEVKNTVQPSEPDFVFGLISRTIPQEPAFTKKPDPSDSAAYGGYLVKAAACVECHSKFNEQQQLIPGSEFGGGREFPLPGGILRTPNITFDKTGIGSWSKDLFIYKFKQYGDSNFHLAKLGPEDANTLMPWTMYSGMTKEDLSSIYQYLKTVKPVKNEVIRFSSKKEIALN